MSLLRTTTAAVTAAAVLVVPATLLAGPAHADGPSKEKVFRVAGAVVDFKVEKDDGRFDVDVDLDNAQPGTRWRIVLRHEGKVFLNRVYRADGDGEVEIDRTRRNTSGSDTFNVRVTKVGGASNARLIRLR